MAKDKDRLLPPPDRPIAPALTDADLVTLKKARDVIEQAALATLFQSHWHASSVNSLARGIQGPLSELVTRLTGEQTPIQAPDSQAPAGESPAP